MALVGMGAGCAFKSTGTDISNDTELTDTSVAKVTPAQKPAEVTSDFSRSKLIAADFVATIAQIPATDPASTTLHTDEPTTRFGELLLGSLQQAGFDLRFGAESSDYRLAYNAIRDEQLSANGNPVYTFIIAAGDVKLKRSYEVDQYGVRPTGGMFVHGASVNNVVSDDSMFSISQPKPEPEIELDTPTTEPLPEERIPQPAVNTEPTIAELDNKDAVKQYLDKNDSESEWVYEKSNKVLTPEEKLRLEQARELEESVEALAPARDLANGNNFNNSDAYAEVPNVYDSKQSRYQDILKDYDVVETSVLVFANDSLVLGRDNKNTIRQYANSFNAETDVMSVIGCSHGATKLENGNGYLANGRAFLDPNQVLEEGCWAEVAYPEMPSRGVLVQHKRLIQN